MDYVTVLTTAPRLLSAAMMAVGDYNTGALAQRLYGRGSTWLVHVSLQSCWFMQYCAGRTITAVPETTVTMMALARYPWNNKQSSTSVSYVWWVGVGCCLRPTTAIFFLPLLLVHVYSCNNKIALSLKIIGTTLVVSALLCVADSAYYGSFTFVPWNFLRFNVLTGLADHYGRQPWHWYISSGLPSALGPHVLLLLSALYTNYRRYAQLLLPCCFTLAVYSLIGHKEIRLLLPLLPPLLLIVGDQVTLLLKTQTRSNNTSVLCSRRNLLLGLLIIPNAALLLYFGVAHQRGPLSVVTELNAMVMQHQSGPADGTINLHHVSATSLPLLLFLMPCHSTPLYSHLHMPVATRFLTCEPNLQGLPGYVDEADRFYEHPEAWLAAHLPYQRSDARKGKQEGIVNREHAAYGEKLLKDTPKFKNNELNYKSEDHIVTNTKSLISQERNSNLTRIELSEEVFTKIQQHSSRYKYDVIDPLMNYPSHVIMFDKLATEMQNFLHDLGYQICSTVFHSYIKEGHRSNYIHVYCLPGT
uniref:Mannosyltransferase n=1 Tax=Hirondellea gigas TaxID=1518452 RepID=A0A2P2I3D7_9CRUS